MLHLILFSQNLSGDNMGLWNVMIAALIIFWSINSSVAAYLAFSFECGIAEWTLSSDRQKVHVGAKVPCSCGPGRLSRFWSTKPETSLDLDKGFFSVLSSLAGISCRRTWSPARSDPHILGERGEVVRLLIPAVWWVSLLSISLYKLKHGNMLVIERLHCCQHQLH